MTIKKVTVKFDSCEDCPVQRYTGCEDAVEYGISQSCPLDDSTMMNRYTDIRRPSASGVKNTVREESQ